MKKILIIGTTWPEPKATGAGVRMMQLLHYFLQQNYEITFASTAQPNTDLKCLEDLNISCKQIVLNDPSFDEFIIEEQSNIVLFDRFITEEQFGWRIAQQLPHAIRILDLEDLHCLRKVRQECFKKEIDFSLQELKASDATKREIASIYRCDLSLVISSFEFQILTENFAISEDLLLLLPFMFENVSEDMKSKIPSYSERNDFITIGNFLHEPNWDSVLYLKKTIWPQLRRRIPSARLLIYGAYASEKVMQLHNEKEGFLVFGKTDQVEAVFKKAKVLLAPLRFGAGLKTKLVDGMQCGIPNVTTVIGAEGLQVENKWNGYIANDPNEFIAKAVTLHENEEAWMDCQTLGFEMFNSLFNKDILTNKLTSHLKVLEKDIQTHRAANFIGQMLLHHSLQSTKYLSKWIEEKQKH